MLSLVKNGIAVIFSIVVVVAFIFMAKHLVEKFYVLSERMSSVSTEETLADDSFEESVANVSAGSVEPENEPLMSVAQTAYNCNSEYESQIFARVNELRAEQGLCQLEYDETLRQVAVYRANDLIVNNYFSHYKDDVLQLEVVAKEFGVPGTVTGENLLQSNDDCVDGDFLYQQWYESPTHYENMVRPSFTKMGICVMEYPTKREYYYDDGSFAYDEDCIMYYAVQIFSN